MSVVVEAIAYLTSLNLRVYDGQAEIPQIPAFPYVVVYSDDGTRTAESLCAASDRLDYKIRTVSAGVSAAQVRAVRERVKSLAGQRLMGALVFHDFAHPTIPDNDLPTAVLSGYDQFSIHSA